MSFFLSLDAADRPVMCGWSEKERFGILEYKAKDKKQIKNRKMVSLNQEGTKEPTISES